MANREINYKKQLVARYFEQKEFRSDCLIILMFVVFLTFLKPFGMHEMSYFTGGVFWSVMCFTGYLIYSPVIYCFNLKLENILPNSVNRFSYRLILSTVFASILMGMVSPLIINQFFGIYTSYINSLPMSIMTSLVIGGVITGASAVKNQFKQQKEALINLNLEVQEPKSQTSKCIQVDEFIANIPIDKRGPLLCLQMDDHYVRVITDKGEHLILMRFKDALTQLKHYEGMQTHRSWWVALDAVKATKREGRKWILILHNGQEVPVSQTYLAQIKQILNL